MTCLLFTLTHRLWLRRRHKTFRRLYRPLAPVFTAGLICSERSTQLVHPASTLTTSHRLIWISGKTNENKNWHSYCFFKCECFTYHWIVFLRVEVGGGGLYCHVYKYELKTIWSCKGKFFNNTTGVPLRNVAHTLSLESVATWWM